MRNGRNPRGLRAQLRSARRRGHGVRVRGREGRNPAGSSGEVLILEVTDLDEEGQPCEFELLDDEEIAAQIYDEFREATKDLYDFE